MSEGVDGEPSRKIFISHAEQSELLVRLKQYLRGDASVYMPIEDGLVDESSQIAGQTDQTSVGPQTELRSSGVAPGAGGCAGMEHPNTHRQRWRRLIGRNIQRRLDELGYSQGQLARMLNVAPSQVWDWVHGRHAPEHYLDKIAEKLDKTPVDYFTTEHNDEENAA